VRERRTASCYVPICGRARQMRGISPLRAMHRRMAANSLACRPLYHGGRT